MTTDVWSTPWSNDTVLGWGCSCVVGGTYDGRAAPTVGFDTALAYTASLVAGMVRATRMLPAPMCDVTTGAGRGMLVDGVAAPTVVAPAAGDVARTEPGGDCSWDGGDRIDAAEMFALRLEAIVRWDAVWRTGTTMAPSASDASEAEDDPELITLGSDDEADDTDTGDSGRGPDSTRRLPPPRATGDAPVAALPGVSSVLRGAFWRPEPRRSELPRPRGVRAPLELLGSCLRSLRDDGVRPPREDSVLPLVRR